MLSNLVLSLPGGIALRRWLLALLCVLAVVPAWGQRTVRGRVVDAQSGEALPYAHVLLGEGQRGVVADLGGYFAVSCADSVKQLRFSMMGYESKTVRIGKSGNLKVRLSPVSNNLPAVTISGQRSRKRYSRKDNPAVELVERVIERKDSNCLQAVPYYSCHRYSKTNMALDEFHPDFNRHFLWKRLPFAEQYIDRTPFDNTEILHFSINENMREEYHRESGSVNRSIITANRSDGLGAILDAEGLEEGPEGIFSAVDIYQNDIKMMENHFVGPLSSTMANSTYHYFITDTVEVDGVKCVELSFRPVSKSEYAFEGRMYVAVGDSSYAVARYEMMVARYANINFVHHLRLRQSYRRDAQGHYLPERSDVYCRMALAVKIKMLRQLYLHQTNIYSDFSFADTAAQLPDSLFGPATTLAVLPDAYKVRRAQWNEMRPIELSEPELLIDSFRYELQRVPWARRLVRGARILGTGYIPTSESFDSSRFDIGPIYNFYSVNALEGRRFRVGGMTKAQLNPRNFGSGYVAYGTWDEHFKFGLNYAHTFDDKRKFAYERPLHLVSASVSYDVESPGVAFGLFDHDNILLTSTTRMMEYVGSAQLGYQKQWGRSINLDTRLSAQRHEPVGDLSYSRRGADGAWQPVGLYGTVDWRTKVSFSPDQKGVGTRSSGAMLENSAKALTMSMTHTMGWFEGFYYNSTTIDAHKTLWLTPFGYLDLRLDAGKVWGQVPLPKLFFPSGTASVYLIPGAFNALTPMEFVADQYVAFFANYHLRGLIFNHLPVIRRFKLREVASFSLYWGSLSERNDPDSGREGLYRLPQHTQRLGTMPYMEYSIGVENILHVIRIDYVNRLTYAEGDRCRFADCLRIGVQLSL